MMLPRQPPSKALFKISTTFDIARLEEFVKQPQLAVEGVNFTRQSMMTGSGPSSLHVQLL